MQKCASGSQEQDHFIRIERSRISGVGAKVKLEIPSTQCKPPEINAHGEGLPKQLRVPSIEFNPRANKKSSGSKYRRCVKFRSFLRQGALVDLA